MQQKSASSFIFPPVRPIPALTGKPRLRQEILQQIQKDPETLRQFNRLSLPDQEALLEFCMGNRGLQITYDPFFREIFHPVKHRSRLDQFLSAILKQKVIVRGILPREGVRFSEEASFMIMDILVETEDGSLINVEMQKIGYDFPIERAFCYGADLLVRQYDRIRDLLKEDFKYKAMRPVYIIVLMESSPAVFQQTPDFYLHHSVFQFDSGLSIKSLINFIYIPLDIFLTIPHNELTELEAWLYFLSSADPLHVRQITEKYPFFKELYRDIIHFRYHPKELISMYSESLAIADRNTIKYMIDELKQQVKEKDSALLKKEAVLSEKEAENQKLKKELSQLKELLEMQ